MEEEGSSEAAQDRRGADSDASVGTDEVRSSPAAAASPAVVVRKTVKMSETRDFIPCASEGDYSRSSGSSSSAAECDLNPDAASCTGSSESAPRDGDAVVVAGMQHTPDYTRRAVPARVRIAPLELFSAAPSPPAEPCQELKCPVKPSPAEDAPDGAAVPEAGAGGGGAQEETTDSQIAQGTLHVEKGNGDCCGPLRQEYDSLLREQVECRRLLEDLIKENELKSKECHEAQTSLHELQTELMRKSMHVGSLAFAVEGQVKEKTRWCQLLKDLSEKFKALKTEHQVLVKESEEYKKCLSDAAQMTTTIHQYVNRYASLQSEFKDLKEKFSEEAKERKDLYNKLIELKGNIRVFCRCRPLNTEEIAEGASMAIDFESAKDGELIVRGHVSSKKVFKFDSVFNPEEDQEKVFEKTAPFATSVLDGFNVCIFAYGQTGTGKTFTMEGTEGARGVNYRILDELFRVVKDRQDLFQYEITVSALEVYNEQIRDLLLTGCQPSTTTKRLEVRQVAEGVHHVPGLVEARVGNMDEAWDVLQTGSKARVVGSTNANEHSSRSHCIHCVMVKGENLMNGERTNSKLWLIDLAGSERVAKTDAQGERLKEAQNINKSLSALGDVISALATKSQHIPFRNSKLTHLLQDSLSGDSKTLMFVQISPNENDVGETLCSLNFASRVRGIELGQARKQVDVGELSRYKLMVGRAKQDCKSKDAQIKTMEETIQSLEAKNKAKDLLTTNLQDKIKELESQLLVERKIARQHVDNKIAQDVERKQQQQQQSLKEESNTYMRSPMKERNLNSTMERPPASAGAGLKDFGIAKQMFSDSSNIDTYSFNQLMSLPEEKENNNPEAAANSKARRVSLCNGGAHQQHPANPRRSSLIPLPRRTSLMPLSGGAKTPAGLPAMAASPLDKIKEYSSPPLCSPPVMSNDKGSRSKRINSILRRSLQKKVLIRPPPSVQTARRAGAAAVQGVDGARRTPARRLPVTGGALGGGAPRGVGVHQNRDKERGWNTGTTSFRNY